MLFYFILFYSIGVFFLIFAAPNFVLSTFGRDQNISHFGTYNNSLSHLISSYLHLLASDYIFPEFYT